MTHFATVIRAGRDIHVKWDLLKKKHAFLIQFHVPKPTRTCKFKIFPN